MSVAGVIGLFRAQPQHGVGPDGRMALADHLRELRARLLRVAVFLVVGTTIAWFFYPQLFNLILDPYLEASRLLAGKVNTKPVITGAAAPLMLQLKISCLAAVVLGSPYWLYEIWAFILPACTRTSGAGRGCSRWSPDRCSWSASASATTCCPRVCRSCCPSRPAR